MPDSGVPRAIRGRGLAKVSHGIIELRVDLRVFRVYRL